MCYDYYYLFEYPIERLQSTHQIGPCVVPPALLVEHPHTMLSAVRSLLPLVYLACRTSATTESFEVTRPLLARLRRDVGHSRPVGESPRRVPSVTKELGTQLYLEDFVAGHFIPVAPSANSTEDEPVVGAMSTPDTLQERSSTNSLGFASPTVPQAEYLDGIDLAAALAEPGNEVTRRDTLGPNHSDDNNSPDEEGITAVGDIGNPTREQRITASIVRMLEVISTDPDNAHRTRTLLSNGTIEQIAGSVAVSVLSYPQLFSPHRFDAIVDHIIHHYELAITHLPARFTRRMGDLLTFVRLTLACVDAESKQDLRRVYKLNRRRRELFKKFRSPDNYDWAE